MLFIWLPNGDLSGYALRRTAKENEKDFSQEVVDAVLKDFYVDYLLKSFADSERAVHLIKQLGELLARGGFEFTKWIWNSRSVLSAFPLEERAPTIQSLDLKSESLLMDRALGIHWNIEHDTRQKFSRSYNNSSSAANLTP